LQHQLRSRLFIADAALLMEQRSNRTSTAAPTDDECGDALVIAAIYSEQPENRIAIRGLAVV